MLDFDPPQLDLALTAAQTRLAGLRAQVDTNAYRLLDDETGGLTLDRYDTDWVLSLLADVNPQDPQSAAQAVALGTRIAAHVGKQLNARAVYLKVRPRQANTLVDAKQAGLTPGAPVYGQALTEPLTILENGVRIGVQLNQGLGTGIYLDQRANRLWLRDHARDLRVLNTFAYTCAFSVAAAVGGARQTVSIDAAQPALAQARGNFLLNGFVDAKQHDLIRGDVLAWLPKLARRGDRFDVVVLDPPSYAQVDGKRFQAARDYPMLLAAALAVLAPGGRVLACINHAGVDARRFQQVLADGLRLGRRVAVKERTMPQPVDFPAGRMKAVLLEVA